MIKPNRTASAIADIEQNGISVLAAARKHQVSPAAVYAGIKRRTKAVALCPSCGGRVDENGKHTL